LDLRFFLYGKAKKGPEKKASVRRFFRVFTENSRFSTGKIAFVFSEKKVVCFLRKKGLWPPEKDVNDFLK
jgi:hypothetical protein